MAHKKGVGSSRNGRESHSKRLGIKIFGGQHVIREISSSVSVVLNTCPAIMLESEKIIRSML